MATADGGEEGRRGLCLGESLLSLPQPGLGGPSCACGGVRALKSPSRACEEQGRVSAATRMQLKPPLVLWTWACKRPRTPAELQGKLKNTGMGSLSLL